MASLPYTFLKKTILLLEAVQIDEKRGLWGKTGLWFGRQMDIAEYLKYPVSLFCYLQV